MRMLEHEGFAHEHYLDIFDGGPTMTARTDAVRSIRDAASDTVAAIDGSGGVESIVATGRLFDFRCGFGQVESASGLTLSQDVADLLGIAEGDTILHVPRL
jgi:arginine N-succinyltransferase